jgi:hypothetical protein
MRVAILFAATVIGCVGQVPENSAPDASRASTDSMPVTGFRAGDLFNYTALPASLRSQMVETMLAELNYATLNTPRALAISASGLGFVRRQTPHAVTQAELNTLALQGCFAISGGQPCALIAVADKFALDESALASSFTFTMSTPTAISPDQIPFLTAEYAQLAVSGYNAAPSPKALVISVDNTYAWIGNQAESPVTTAEARQIALEICEVISAAAPCTVFAENNNIVFDPTNLNRAAVIDYARTTVNARIPTTRPAFYANSIVPNYLGNVPPQNGVIYIQGNGAIYWRYDANAALAESQALSDCNATATTLPCFRYAVNRTIQPLTKLLRGPVVYGQNVFCKVIPRATCAVHKALGCPAGSYYTTTSGSVALENCP